MLNDKPLNILLVDDDPLSRNSVQRWTEQTDFCCQLTMANSCAEALSWLRDQRFDIVLLDYPSDDSTGLEILTDVIDPPVIFITEQGNEQTVVKAMQQGADEFLIKGVDGDYLKLLLKTIRSVVQKKQTEQQLRWTQFALDHAPDPVFCMRKDGSFAYVNEAACRALGYSVALIT